MTDTRTATVLIVDDEPEIVELYERFLDPYYDVRTATDGEVPLEQADETVDIIFLDRHMPEVTGDEVPSELRTRGTSSHIAMLTGVKPIEKIADMPFDDYKIKPVGRAELLGLIKVLLERARYDEASQEYFSVAAKKAGLEFADNTDTHVYENLVEQLTTLCEELDESLDEMRELPVTDEISV